MTLHELAKDAWKDQQDLELAGIAVKQRLDADSSLYRDVTMPLLEWAIQVELETCMRAMRGRMLESARSVPEPTPRPEAMAALRRRAIVNLLDYPLSGGLRLRDATGHDLLKEEDLLRKPAITKLMKAAWFAQMRMALSSLDAAVGDELDADQVQALWNEVASHQPPVIGD